MSEISDELREWAAEECSAPALYALADRIDAETIELPLGADGRPIHVGDTVYACDDLSLECKVTSIELSNKGVTVDIESDGIRTYRHPGGITHERPDSWERIADELDAWCDRTDVDGDACGEPRELARRIRRLAEREVDGR